MIEVEQKFHLPDVDALVEQLARLGAIEQADQNHADTYFNHPARDFRETREALRIRRIDGVPLVTYKGPKLPGKVKAREEMEWRLDPGDTDGSQTQRLWTTLGFRNVATVRKHRRIFTVAARQPVADPITITIDTVEGLGKFAEIEIVVESAGEVESARQQITSLGDQFGLRQDEQRSYLTMLLETQTAG